MSDPLTLANKQLATERVNSGLASVLYLAALRHVEGERDRARATAVRLEQLLAVASSEFEGVGL